MTTVTGDAVHDARATAPPEPPAEGRLALARAAEAVRRARLGLICLGFVVLTMLQSPGLMVADTKLDLIVDPLAFLGRALSLWEPEGFAGTPQNQAYGYFFPMGPFFALGDVVGLPAWVVQRLWLALLLSVAFLGVVVLARRLRIGTPGTAILAGLAYALAPRMVTALGSVSVEVTPMALTPWVLVPLVGVTRLEGTRRAAALSGLALFFAGGVNATAVVAVLPLAVLYLLTRPAGPLRRRLVLWWSLCVGLASVWWAGPLLLLGRYSPPFLDYVESATATTVTTDLLSVLRGTSHWVATLSSPSGPIWPAGRSLIDDALPATATVLLAVAGLVALARRDLPERTWLVLGLLAGVGLVSLGHLAAVDGAWAGSLNEALDHELSPLRNAHKFDPVLRLPLVLGLAHLAAVLVRSGRGPHAQTARASRVTRTGARALLIVMVLALVGTASPALAGRLTPPRGFEEIPAHWQQTADFLAAEQSAGRALLVPASAFGTYEWGNTGDEPLQPLARSPWEVRAQWATPMTPGAHIRLLDAVEERLSRGDGSAGLTRTLARSGYSHLVLRNDLDTGEARSTRSSLVRQALLESPGITQVAAFGPDYPTVDRSDGLLYDAGLVEPTAAVQIYAIEAPAPQAWTAPVSSAVTVHGGSEAILGLEDRGLITDSPVLLAGESSLATPLTMVSDALMRRERSFGRVVDATSGGLTVDEPLRLDKVARDYPIPGLAEAESVVEYIGGTPSASSSASDVDGFSASRPEAQPWAALDRDLLTAWQPRDKLGQSQTEWWRLTTDESFSASEITVILGSGLGGRRPESLRLTTDAGERVVPVADTDLPQVLPLPEGSSRSLTISETAAGGNGVPLVLGEVVIPGVEVYRTVVTPPPSSPVDVYAFNADLARPGCLTASDGTPRCAEELLLGSEDARLLDRVFTVAAPDVYDISATAVPRPGPALDDLLTEVRGTVRAAASSSAVADPRGSAMAAVDGDPETAWLPMADDDRPTLVLTWPEPRPVDTLSVVVDPDLAAVGPTKVTVAGGGASRTVSLDDDGTASFRPIVTDRLEVTFRSSERLRSFDPTTGWSRPVTVGVSELEVGVPNPVVRADTPVDMPCGAGPSLLVDDRLVHTAVRTTVGALQAIQPVPLTVCDDSRLDLPAGEHRVIMGDAEGLSARSVTLLRVEDSTVEAAAGRETAEVTRWDHEHRTVAVGARSEDTLLIVPENTNPGWRATLDGRRLEAVSVDGWQQGYVLPAGAAGTVQLDFGPGSAYRGALAGGAVAVLFLVLLACLPGRPSRTPPASRREWGASSVPASLLVATVAVFGMALVSGLVGVGLLAALWLVARAAGRHRGAVLGTVAATALLVAGALLLTVHVHTGDAQQALAVTALAAVVAGVLPEIPGLQTWPAGWRARGDGRPTPG